MRGIDAINLADMVKRSLDMGFGNERPMGRSMFEHDIVPWNPPTVRHVYGV